MKPLTYSDLKALIARKNLAWQYEERPDRYRVFATDSGVTSEAFIFKSPIVLGGLNASAEAANQTDFETNYKSLANYAIGVRPYPFSTPDFLYNGSGILATVPHGTSTSIDFKVPGTVGTFQYINGAEVITNNAAFGDWASSQVVDVDNVLGYGTNTVLSSYIHKWYINPAQALNLVTQYAGKLPSGCYVRVTYTSVGSSDVGVAINFRLHTPLP